jgi:hypothetical protein
MRPMKRLARLAQIERERNPEEALPLSARYRFPLNPGYARYFPISQPKFPSQ